MLKAKFSQTSFCVLSSPDDPTFGKYQKKVELRTFSRSFSYLSPKNMQTTDKPARQQQQQQQLTEYRQHARHRYLVSGIVGQQHGGPELARTRSITRPGELAEGLTGAR